MAETPLMRFHKAVAAAASEFREATGAYPVGLQIDWDAEPTPPVVRSIRCSLSAETSHAPAPEKGSGRD